MLSLPYSLVVVLSYVISLPYRLYNLMSKAVTQTGNAWEVARPLVYWVWKNYVAECYRNVQYFTLLTMDNSFTDRGRSLWIQGSSWECWWNRVRHDKWLEAQFWTCFTLEADKQRREIVWPDVGCWALGRLHILVASGECLIKAKSSWLN